jgi:uncharacterized protein (TIGR03000 family)
MFRKSFSFAGTLLLVGVALLMMPGFGQAQHGGGGHGGGGGHFGGGVSYFGGGVSHFGGGVSHFGGGSHFGSPASGAGNGRYHHYSGRYGYYPNYGLYGGSYPYYYDSYPYTYSGPTYDSGYSDTYGEAAPDYGYGSDVVAPPTVNYRQLYPSSAGTAQADTSAHLTVNVPPDAQLWFNDTLTTVTGMVRQFESPPLAAGKYSYDVQARWKENGNEVLQRQQVVVTAGAHVNVSFPVSP